MRRVDDTPAAFDGVGLPPAGVVRPAARCDRIGDRIDGRIRCGIGRRIIAEFSS